MGVGTGVLRLLLETGVASSLGTSIPTKLNWMSPNDGREDGKWGDDLVISGTWTDGKRIESWKMEGILDLRCSSGSRKERLRVKMESETGRIGRCYPNRSISSARTRDKFPSSAPEP